MTARALRSPLGTLLGAALFALCLAVPVDARAQVESDPAAQILKPDVVVVIDLTLPPASIEALEAKPEEYRDGTFSLALTDGGPGGVGEPSAPIDVGIRLKGHGSFKPLSEKAAFKVKFNHSVKGQKVLGLKKLTLNNMAQDPSMVREALAYEAFRAAGVAAPRTGYAFVRVNGEDYGLYLNVETLDDVSLARWFGSTAHLYEGGLGSDVTPGGAAAFEVDEGDEKDRGDLEALIAAANGEPADWSEGMAGVADLEQMARMWAVEKYVGHWDGYAGIVGSVWPNNFYLHSDGAGVFSMLPWGTDLTWIERLPFDGAGGRLFNLCLADASCAAGYRSAVAEAATAISALDLDLRAEGIAARLLPWQQIDPRRPYSLDQIEDAVEGTRAFISTRGGEVAAWLDPPPPGQPAGQGSPSSSTESPAKATSPMRIERLSVANGVVSTRLGLPAPGWVGQRVSISTADGPVVACSTRVEVKEATSSTLRCQLSASTRRRLRARRLRLRVETRFASEGRALETLTRTILARS